ncbi:MAG TPA: hypothetical protein VGW36_08170 [Pyrinomonadaceae bacterium]|nr:hypothetical protein [Pyrinomonadaceae bacterium]
MNRLKISIVASMVLVSALLLSSNARAQDTAGHVSPADVQVLKYSWSKDRVGWERDPFSGPIENFDEMRVRTRNEKRIMDAKRGGSSIEANKVEREALTDQALINTIHKAPRARYGFTYKLSVQNNGTKQIEAIDWDYVFLDLMTEQEVGRREFGSAQKIAPGKKREMSFFIPSPPARKISVQSLDKHERDGLGERIELVRIQYSDGSTWQRPEPKP